MKSKILPQASKIHIGGRRIGPGEPVYIVAEMSANHHQDYEEAVNILRAAKDAGADAVKIQTYTADTITLRSDKDFFRLSGGTLWDGRQLHDLYREAYTPWEWQPRLKAIAEEIGLDLFSAAFDPTAVEFLENMGVPVHKVASFEIVDIPLIRCMARTGKPLIISTGMASREEIGEAVEAARQSGAVEIAILKCTSAYPAPPAEMNLLAIPDLAAAFEVPVGLSDHTLGITVPVAGVTLGACIVEKHLTMTRSKPGPDSAFSLEPHEFKYMVDAIRTAEKSLGRADALPSERELPMRSLRRSLFVVADVKAGDLITERNVRSIRPGYGLHTRHMGEVIGRRAVRDLEKGTPLAWEMLT
ncbi:MAG: pseudaminic acid synthase [Candidatus Omnitrophota bacterium]|nr:pseudaminic acid synthase [Candidatus Omnitrophota bacterium]